MNLAGLALCSRFSYPPNSLSLCGPHKPRDLNWYAVSQTADKGTFEILSQFSTLFPYLCLIASQNKINDPFDCRVVEAYWLGNTLLNYIPTSLFINHLSDNLGVKKKIGRKDLHLLFDKVGEGATPHHSFHVLNVYKRTGHLDIKHTIETMDACLINWGRVKKILAHSLIVETKPLTIINGKLSFGSKKERHLLSQGTKDILFGKVKIGDFVSYHWGYFCQKLSQVQLKNLIYYTSFSLKLVNQTPSM